MNTLITNTEEEPPKAVVTTFRVLTDKSPAPTEAYMILKRTLQFLELLGMVIGLEMSYSWKNNIRFGITKFLTVLCWSQFFYTQFVNIYQGNAFKSFEVFAIYGVGISTLVKIWCHGKYHINVHAIHESSLKICQRNTGSRGDRLNQRVQNNFHFLKCVTLSAIVLIIIYLFYPVKSFLIDGKLVPLVPVEFMFIDQSTLSGYIIASCIMTTAGIYGTILTTYMGLTFVLIIINYSLRVDLLEIDIEELNDMWSDTSKSTAAYRRLFLRNIIRKCIDMREYVAEIKNIFAVKMFIFFAFSYLSQILCYYQIFVNNWIPGFALAFGFFLEMNLYCMMGTKAAIENERSCFIITQSKWYTYDLKSQKLMLTLLCANMNSQELWIGPIAPLSVYTATQMIKGIYTYYTVMAEIM
ncbi:odorant receptor 67d-like [Bradysia coprophila]|uniref:odorant receptor 67d-like n=1 Tax=Bradysia coprophila TaxID=38358 RepID=UPI00187D9F5B|nr:odorant receptor 67d-like [Bradysia coprophila]